MDLNIINILTVIILFIVVLLVALHLYTSQHFGTLERLGIPCEKPWPILGNIASELFSVLHEHDVKLYKKYGAIYGHYESKLPTIRIADTEMLREILIKQFPNFADRRDFQGSGDTIVNRTLLFLKGDSWKQIRALLTPVFTSGKLKQMTPLIEKCLIQLSNEFYEKSKTGESFEAKEAFGKYMNDVIASCVFGMDMNIRGKDREEFMKNAKLLVADQSLLAVVIATFAPGFILKLFFFPLIKKFYEGIQFFKKIGYSVIKMRQSTERRNDFLQMLLDRLKDEDEINDNKKHNDKKVLTVDDVVASTVSFLFAGFETTAKFLSFSAHALTLNQECQDKLLEELDNTLEKNKGKVDYNDVAEMKYMDMFIMETLRCYPPVVRLERLCLKTTKINDLVIPKDTLVIIPVYAMHYDEKFYPEANRFNPQRFSPENKDQMNQFAFFGFGIGPRNCIGMRFSLMVIKLTLAYILKDYRFVRGPKTQVPLRFKKSSINLNLEEDLHVYVEKRSTTILKPNF